MKCGLLPLNKRVSFLGWNILFLSILLLAVNASLLCAANNNNSNRNSNRSSSNRSSSNRNGSGGSYGNGGSGGGYGGDNYDLSARNFYGWGYRSAVGGFSIDAENAVRIANAEEVASMTERMRSLLAEVPADLDSPSSMRKISLRRLAAELNSCRQNGRPIPDSLLFLGGLTRIDYIAAVPEEHDIYLAGPAEGWTVTDNGQIVGKESGKPILRLEDLLTVFRAWDTTTPEVITCSIDPTQEGIAAVSALGAEAGDAERESAMGLMDVTFGGISSDSRMAMVLAAADYRLKTISLGYEEVPVKNFPSYFEMIKTGTTSSYGQRFWISPEYKKLSHGTDSLTWQLSETAIQTLTEREHLNADGSRKAVAKKDVQAQRWAAAMSKRFDEVAEAVPVFADAKNCMEIALAVAVIYSKQLPQKAGLSLDTLKNEDLFPQNPLPVPTKVAGFSLSRTVGNKAVISVTGGITINPWETVQNGTSLDAELDTLTAKVSFGGDNWFTD